LLLFTAIQLSSQQPAAPKVCGGGRTIDDYLADLAKEQKKKRNKNPFPDSVCVWGWCKTGVKKPPADPLPDPPSVSDDQKRDAQQAAPPPGTSSSKQTGITPPPAEVTSVDPSCDPQQAAKDVDVGDYYFDQKNYKAALNRYKLALEEWSSEPAIHFRAAKTYEALKDRDHATAEYHSVIDLVPNTSLAQEAQTSLSRLPK
jgi:tetratricopeptide (TPR) repeat protein